MKESSALAERAGEARAGGAFGFASARAIVTSATTKSAQNARHVLPLWLRLRLPLLVPRLSLLVWHQRVEPRGLKKPRAGHAAR